MTALKEKRLPGSTDVVVVLLVIIVFKKYNTVKKIYRSVLEEGRFFCLKPIRINKN